MGKSKLTILIVDDEKGIQESIRETLKTNYNIISAFNDLQAMTELDKTEINLIILDYILSKSQTDGLELLHNIRFKYHKLPVVFLTGYACCRILTAAYNYGNVTYIAKPFDIKEFRETISRILNKQPLYTFETVLHQTTIEQRDMVNEIIIYISENYSNSSLSAIEIAESLKIRIHDMNKMFRKKMGHTPTEHLSMHRIKRAKEYLLNLDMSIKEVADRVGIPNIKTFYNLLNKHCGITPQEYRNKLS
jgi:YesN/AraC family two-component response regulator